MYINLPKRDAERRIIDGLLDGDIPFGFHYQPIVDLERGVVTGYEALARFPEEVGARPDEVFQMAGNLGRRAELEVAVLRSVLSERAKMPPNCFLTVNAGPNLLVSHHWDRLLKYFDGLSGVVVEITEDEPVRDYRALRPKLDTIREAGGFIAVDDTGAGYASLKHVMELRPNFIKLDRFFVGGCHKESARSSMIEMLGNVASRLDAWIIAEGVETAGELEELLHLSVPLAQGYHLGRPEAVMQPLSVHQSNMIRARAQALQDGNLKSVLEPCFSTMDQAAAAAYLEANPETYAVAIVDEGTRPLELMERHPLVGIRNLKPPMKAQQGSDIKEVLHRCLARTPEHRFDPVVVLGDDGRFEGIALVDRMMKLVLDREGTMGIRAAEMRALFGHPGRFSPSGILTN